MKVKQTTCALLTMVLLLLLTSCGGGGGFKVTGQLEDKSDINIRFIYYDGKQLVNGLTASRNGKFEFSGKTMVPTVLELTDNDYRPMGYLYVADGDELTAQFTPGQPDRQKVTGNEVNERLSEMLNSLEGKSVAEADKAIEALQKSESETDRTVAGVLMQIRHSSRENFGKEPESETVMQPFRYMSVNDTADVFTPSNKGYTLLVVHGHGSDKPLREISDSIRKVLKERKEKLTVFDLSVDGVEGGWRSAARYDTIRWKRGWSPGGAAMPGIYELNVSELPCYLLADSSGMVKVRAATPTELLKNFPEKDTTPQ